MKYKISTWPATADRPGEILWIGSPQQKGENRQWMSELALAYLDERMHVLRNTFHVWVPWGALPAVKVGDRLHLGKKLDRTPWPRHRFTIDTSAHFEVVDAGAVPSDLCNLPQSVRRGERCLRISSGADTLLVSCVEIARALFAPSSFLANALMEPDLLDDCMDATQEGKTACITLGDQVPLTMARSPLAELLSLILLDHEWRAEFQRVDISRLPERPPPTHSRLPRKPLVCAPSLLRNCDITVEADHFGPANPQRKQLYARSVESVSFSKPFPFSTVICEHVKLQVPGGDSARGGGGGKPGTGSGGEPGSPGSNLAIGGEARRGTKGLEKRSGNAVTLSFGSYPRLHFETRYLLLEPDEAPKPSRSGGGVPDEGEPHREVSAGTRSRIPSEGRPGLAFTPPGRKEWPEDFRKVQSDLRRLLQSYPKLQMECTVSNTAVEDEAVNWMLIVMNRLADGCVLEVQRRSAQRAHWIIVFGTKTRGMEQAAAEALIKAAFKPTSGWSQADLKRSAADFRFLTWMRHKTSGGVHAQKVFDLVRRRR